MKILVAVEDKVYGRAISDLERLLIGSTSLAVLAQSPCSVMIVKLPQNNNEHSATTKQTTPAILAAAPHSVP